MRVDGGGRREPERLPDVPHRRRIAVARGVLLDEVEDLLLALRQVLSYVHAARLLSSRTCVRTRYKGSRTDSTLRAILALPRADGGIGRRARLRAWSGITGWRFESSSAHLRKPC